MPSYKKKALFRPARVGVQVDVKFQNKKETYQIKVNNLRKSDLKLSTEPAKWQKIPISRNLILLVSNATRQTDFAEIGDKVFMLKFRDGRTIRFYPNDISYRAFSRLKRQLELAKS